MKKTILSLFFVVFVSCQFSLAQQSPVKKDSSKKSDYFSKYKKNTTPKSTEPKVNNSMVTKKEEKRVESSYQTENNRVVGGKTVIKVRKKN